MSRIAEIFLGLILSLVLVCTGAGVSVTHCAHAEMGMMEEMENDATGCDDGASCMYLTFEQLEPFSASQTVSMGITLPWSQWQLSCPNTPGEPDSTRRSLFTRTGFSI